MNYNLQLSVFFTAANSPLPFPLLPLQGSHPEVVLQCTVLGMQSPLFLLLSAKVQGLSVSYHLPSSAGEDRLVELVCEKE